MATFNGMDTAQGDAFGQSLREGHARLSDVLGRVRERVRESDAIWQGPDADAFRADGEAMSTRLGDPALEHLARAVDELLGHVEEQEQASSADGAGGGSAGPERRFMELALATIRSSGTGEEGSPLRVLRVQDEYDILGASGLRSIAQTEVASQGRVLDRHDLTDGSQLWFELVWRGADAS